MAHGSEKPVLSDTAAGGGSGGSCGDAAAGRPENCMTPIFFDTAARQLFSHPFAPHLAAGGLSVLPRGGSGIGFRRMGGNLWPSYSPCARGGAPFAARCLRRCIPGGRAPRFAEHGLSAAIGATFRSGSKKHAPRRPAELEHPSTAAKDLPAMVPRLGSS
jgi:hypothetical protein